MEDTVIAALKHDILLPVVTQTIYNPNTLGKVLPAPFYERYRICERLGEGSYGEVLKALQLATGQEVAVKILRMRQDSDAPPAASQITRFRREMQLCARLHHPNIVRLIDFDSVADILYIVFEFIPGKTLAEVLRAETRLDFAETIHLLGQVLDALHCAHNQGVVHRDLKPENIMITDTGARRNAMVLDFGVAAFIDSDTPKSNAGSYPVTLSGEILGSPA
jgi:serine/threonine protein kinase